MEGPLSKWTNVMKGWQYRWFVLDYNAGLLSYYTVRSLQWFVNAERVRPCAYTAEVVAACQTLSGIRGLVFVRSWESQLAKQAGPCRDGSAL